MKQACQDESVVSLFFPISICIYIIYVYLSIYLSIYLYIYIYIYIYRKSASRFSRETVLNTSKQSRINIMRGKK